MAIGPSGAGGAEAESRMWLVDGTGVTKTTGGPAAAVSEGVDHRAVVRPDRTTVCSGENEHGQLGNGETGSEEVEPVTALVPRGRAQQVSSGRWFTVVVCDDNKIFTWGRTLKGRLGRKGPGHIPAEVTGLPAGDPVVLFAAGGDHVIVVTRSGKVYGWGDNEHGQLALGECGGHHTTPVLTMLSDKYRIRRLSCGLLFTVVETVDGQLLSWGGGPRDMEGGWFADRDHPEPTPLYAAGVEFPLRSLAAGDFHACAADAAGNVYRWGFPMDAGRLNAERVQLPEGEKAVCVAAASLGLTVALTESGTLYDCCTGRNINADNPDLPLKLTPFGGCDAEFITLAPLRTCGILRLGAVDFAEPELELPLCDAGITAEVAVELLRPPPEGTKPAGDGPLVLYIRRPGLDEPLCLEVDADATVGGVAALAAERLGL